MADIEHVSESPLKDERDPNTVAEASAAKESSNNGVLQDGVPVDLNPSQEEQEPSEYAADCEDDLLSDEEAVTPGAIPVQGIDHYTKLWRRC